MDQGREYRYTVPGWALIASALMFYWLFDGSFDPILSKDWLSLVAALAGFAASPFLGMVPHILLFQLIHLLRGDSHHTNIPRDKDEFKQLISALSSCNEIGPGKEELKLAGETLESAWTVKRRSYWRLCKDQKEAVKVIYRESNRVGWSYGSEPQTQTVVRGWTLYWTWMNIAAAIVVGGALAALVRCYQSLDSGHGGSVDLSVLGVYDIGALLVLPVAAVLFAIVESVTITMILVLIMSGLLSALGYALVIPLLLVVVISVRLSETVIRPSVLSSSLRGILHCKLPTK